ncbi:MAG: hypothetical protein OEY84_08675, partial [Rhodospirillaceae bacterium]|nr:hypothetical protein [Rhodospirillaceae bacterium]
MIKAMANAPADKTAKNLVIDVSVDADGWNSELVDGEKIATRAIQATWMVACEKGFIDDNLCKNMDVEVSLMLLDDARQQMLNRDYR